MSERFQRLFTLEPNLYSEGCPIIIEAGVLLKDTESGAVLAQLKMRNIGDKNISSCRVSVKAYAPNGDEVEGFSDFSYLDLDVALGHEFGSRTPIMLPDKTARKISVNINEIVFSDGSVKKMNSNQWSSAPRQRTLFETLQSEELVKQYAIEVGGTTELLPEKKGGLFLCTCGAINLESADNCYKCGRTYELLDKCLDRNYLLSKVEERKSKEDAVRAKKEASKKKIIRIASMAAVLVLAIVLFSSLVKFIGVQKQQKEIAQLTETAAKNKLSGVYTSTGAGKKKEFTFGRDGFVTMLLIDSSGKVEYSSTFYYFVRKKENGKMVIDAEYPKGNVCAEYVLTGTDGTWITDFKFTKSHGSWDWKGTYHIGRR